MSIWTKDLINIAFAVILVAINGFFVAAEFAMVKVRPGRLDELVRQGRIFASTAKWLLQRMDASLSTCQLGITMASLGLGWIGEPAVAHLLRPLLQSIGVVSEIWIHGIAFAVAFSGITAAHLVLGEQAPKIYALRRPEKILLLCAPPLKFFYFISYPFMIALNSTTSFLLRKIGIDGGSEHETVHSEDEIKALLGQARQQGELSRYEHRLLNAVFEFNDTVCRRIMQPRSDIIYFDNNLSLADCIALAIKSKHSRYPICDRSLDKVLGVVHIKDLIGVSGTEKDILPSITRPAQFVPETMRISRLLRLFQETHQHLAFVVDEYGTTVGCVTLEDVLEQIVGPVEDEFDTDSPEIEPAGSGQFNIQGGASLATINRQLNLQLVSTEAETLSGLLMEQASRVVKTGDRFELEGAAAEVLEMKGSRAYRIQLTLNPGIAPES